MPLTYKAIEQKIKDLEAKKKDLEIRDSQKLYKHCRQILGDSFSTSLVLSLVSETWSNASPDQKNRWLKADHTFQKSKPPHRKIKKSQEGSFEHEPQEI